MTVRYTGGFRVGSIGAVLGVVVAVIGALLVTAPPAAAADPSPPFEFWVDDAFAQNGTYGSSGLEKTVYQSVDVRVGVAFQVKAYDTNTDSNCTFGGSTVGTSFVNKDAGTYRLYVTPAYVASKPYRSHQCDFKIRFTSGGSEYTANATFILPTPTLSVASDVLYVGESNSLSLYGTVGSTEHTVNFTSWSRTAGSCTVGGATPVTSSTSTTATHDIRSSSVGSCTFTVKSAELSDSSTNTYWNAQTVAQSLTVSFKNRQDVSLADGGASAGSAITLTATQTAGTGSFSYAVASGGTASGCTVSGTSLTASGAGTCLVNATAAADSTYAEATTSTPATFTFRAAAGGSSGGSSGGAAQTTTPAAEPEPERAPATGPMLTSAGATVKSEPATADYLDAEGNTTPADYEPQADGILAGDPDDLRLRLGEGEPNAATIDSSGVITFVRGKKGVARGSGFKPGSEAEVWVFSEPLALGNVTVGGDGSFEVEFDVPDGLPAGEHTIQAEGITPLGAERAITAGVEVVSQAPSPPKKVKDNKIRTTSIAFTFDRLSGTPNGDLSRLTSLLSKRGTTKVTIHGFVQPSGVVANDHALSIKRAEAVASLVRESRSDARVRVVASGRDVASMAPCVAARNRCAVATVYYRVPAHQ